MLRLVRILFFGVLLTLPLTLIKDLGLMRIYTFDVILFPFFITFVLAKIMYPQHLKMHFTRTDVIFVLLFLAMTVSLLFSEDVYLSLPNYADWIRITLIYFLARVLFESNVISQDQFERVLVWIGVLLVAIGLIQLITDTRFGLVANYFGSASDEGSHERLGYFDKFNRLSGTSPNPNVYTMWISIFFSFAIVRWFYRAQYVRFFIGTAIASSIVIGTLSRGGAVAFLLFLLILVFTNGRRLLDSRFLLVSMVALCVAVALGVLGASFGDFDLQKTLGAFEGRVEGTIEQERQGGRLWLVARGVEELGHLKILLVGTGADSFPRGLIIHNMWVRLIAEHGVFVFIAMLALWLSFYGSIRRYRASRTEDAKLWTMYLTSTMVPFLLISSQVYHTAGSYDILIPIVVIMAFIVSRKYVLVRNDRIIQTKEHRQSGNILALAKKGYSVPRNSNSSHG